MSATAAYYEIDYEMPPKRIEPQAGPQTMAMESLADVLLFGGGAGGGKSYALLLEVVRHHHNPKFGSVIFRRNSKQVRNEGALWDESVALFEPLGWRPRESAMEWESPRGARLGFGHLEYERSVYDWQGSQIAMIGFDELTHFTQKQFLYMLSRNRSMSGVPGYIRATCNPDADSWLRTWVDWWIGPNGLPIPERSGVLRWFIRQNDKIIWANSKRELTEKYGEKNKPKSFTFIPSSVYDNKILMNNDPSYLSNLMALDNVERERLLGQNWNIKFSAGNMFKRHWFTLLDAIPHAYTAAIRFWDRAATPVNPNNSDPDWTRGVLLFKYPNGTWLVGDVRSLRGTPGDIEQLILGTAMHDGRNVRVMAQQDPGSAGVGEASQFTRMMQGFRVKTARFSSDKVTRSKALSAQCQAQNVYVLKAPWNEEFFKELDGFPDGKHDDIVDALSGGFNELLENAGWGSLAK